MKSFRELALLRCSSEQSHLMSSTGLASGTCFFTLPHEVRWQSSGARGNLQIFSPRARGPSALLTLAQC